MSEVKRHSVTGYGRQDINYNDPEGEFVYYEDYAELQQKLDALAAEVNGIREQAEDVYAAGYRHGHLNTVDGCAYATPVEDEFYHYALQVMLEVETPATDAYLNSVRAEGLKMAIDHMNNQTSDDCADVTVLPVIEMYKKLISGTHDTADKAG